jgi:hypothetical protein
VDRSRSDRLRSRHGKAAASAAAFFLEFAEGLAIRTFQLVWRGGNGIKPAELLDAFSEWSLVPCNR